MEAEREFFVFAVKVNEITGWPVILLQDREKKTTLSISATKVNAFPIYLALQSKKCPAQTRPLMQDLFLQLVKLADIQISKITIYDFSPEGSFKAKIRLSKGQEDNCIIMNSSASDAIGLAMRLNIAIWVSSKIISRLGSFSLDEQPYCDISERYFFTP